MSHHHFQCKLDLFVIIHSQVLHLTLGPWHSLGTQVRCTALLVLNMTEAFLPGTVGLVVE